MIVCMQSISLNTSQHKSLSPPDPPQQLRHPPSPHIRMQLSYSLTLMMHYFHTSAVSNNPKSESLILFSLLPSPPPLTPVPLLPVAENPPHVSALAVTFVLEPNDPHVSSVLGALG